MDKKLKESLNLEIERLGFKNEDFAPAIMVGAFWVSQRTYSEDEVKELVLKTIITFSSFSNDEMNKKLAEEFFEINKKYLAQ